VESKFRIRFHTALGRIVFSTSEDLDSAYDSFMIPTLDMLSQLIEMNINDVCFLHFNKYAILFKYFLSFFPFW